MFRELYLSGSTAAGLPIAHTRYRLIDTNVLAETGAESHRRYTRVWDGVGCRVRDGNTPGDERSRQQDAPLQEHGGGLYEDRKRYDALCFAHKPHGPTRSNSNSEKVICFIIRVCSNPRPPHLPPPRLPKNERQDEHEKETVVICVSVCAFYILFCCRFFLPAAVQFVLVLVVHSLKCFCCIRVWENMLRSAIATRPPPGPALVAHAYVPE